MPILFASVRKRLFVPLTLAFVLLFAALLIGHRFMQEENRAQAAGRALDFARSFAADYENQISETQALLRHLATLPQAGGNNPEHCRRLLGGLSRTHPQLTHLAVLDRTGGLRCEDKAPSASFAPAGNPDNHDNPVVRQAIDSGSAALGTLGRDQAQGGPVVILVQPAAGEGEAASHFIVAHIDLDRMNRRFAELVPPGSVLRILDREGIFLVRQPNPECCLGRSGLNLLGIREALANGKPQVTESIWLDEVARIQADVPIQHAVGGVASIGIPLELVNAPANRKLAAGMALLLMMSIILYAIAWLGSARFLLRPISALATAARRIHAGDLDCRIPAGPGNDEISTLIRDFNGMAGALAGQQQALRESERRFREMYERAPLPYQSLDAAGTILDVNDAWLGLFDRTKEDVKGRFIGDFLTEDSQAVLGERFARFKRDKHTEDNIFEIVRGDGGRRLVSVNGRVSHDADGEFLCTHCILTDVTARIEHEQHLRLSASVFAHANEAIAITDAHANIVTVSPRFSEITGYATEEVIGKNPRILQSGRQDPAFYRAMWAALASDKGHWSGEIWNRRKDGSLYPEWLSISAVRNDDGVVTNYVAIFTDLSERVAADAAVRSSEQRYRTMFENAPEGVWIIGADECTIEVNRRMCELLGYAPQEMAGRRPTDFTDPANGMIFERQKALRAATRHRIYEVALRHRDGRNIPVNFSATSLYREDGALHSVLAFVTDLSERISAERRLRESEARLASLIEAIPDPIFLKDGDSRWQVINSAANSLFRIEGLAWQGRTDKELALMQPEYSGEHMACWESDEAAWANGCVTHSTEFIHKGEAGVCVLDVCKVPLFDDAGNRNALVILGRDITEQHRFTEELRRINDELESRVTERTQALLTANRELEAFSYSVSHDLRAPLRAINGFSHLIEEEYAASLDDKARNYLSRVRAGSERMGQLIDDLLHLSQMSRQPMHVVPTNLSEIAREIAGEFQAGDPQRRAEWDIAGDIVACGDAGLLRAVLLNLLGNAWKYSSRQETPRIAFGVAEKNGRATYFVRDNGAGFDMAHSAKLFGAFQRLHSPAEFPGSGIGLATVARIIHRHGGEVWAEGRVGEGATFYFTLNAQSVIRNA